MSRYVEIKMLNETSFFAEEESGIVDELITLWLSSNIQFGPSNRIPII